MKLYSTLILVSLGLLLPGARAAVTLTTSHSFTGPDGANPVRRSWREHAKTRPSE